MCHKGTLILGKTRIHRPDPQRFHSNTNLLITGGIDDVWIEDNGDLLIVDYKSTSKKGEVNLDADWQIGYKRQMEIYQWLFRKNDFPVSDTGYFVYGNGITDCEGFNNRLEFNVCILAYEGDSSWVEDTIVDSHNCLISDVVPERSADCDFCKYNAALENLDI